MLRLYQLFQECLIRRFKRRESKAPFFPILEYFLLLFTHLLFRGGISERLQRQIISDVFSIKTTHKLIVDIKKTNLIVIRPSSCLCMHALRKIENRLTRSYYGLNFHLEIES